MLDFAASPDLGLICISKSSGIAIDKPVEINSEENFPKMRKSILANEIVNRIIYQLN